MDAEGVNLSRLATDSKVAKSSLSMFLRGMRGMREEALQRLESATGGVVTEAALTLWMRNMDPGLVANKKPASVKSKKVKAAEVSGGGRGC